MLTLSILVFSIDDAAGLAVVLDILPQLPEEDTHPVQQAARFLVFHAFRQVWVNGGVALLGTGIDTKTLLQLGLELALLLQ
jgi:hypothetical protein